MVINSGCSLRIEVHHSNQPCKTKLLLYKPLLSLLQLFIKQLYINNKTEHFGYRSGCGVHGCRMHNEAFKRRAGLGYRSTALDYYYATKKLKNKAALSVAIHCYVILSNIF